MKAEEKRDLLNTLSYYESQHHRLLENETGESIVTIKMKCEGCETNWLNLTSNQASEFFSMLKLPIAKKLKSTED